MIGKAIFNRAPLVPNRLAALPLGAIQPEGWLAEEIALQLNAVKESLRTRWPEAMGASSWLGGAAKDAADAPERLAGLMPLALVSGDEELIQLTKGFVDWAIESQDGSGDFGPRGLEDWWPKMIMLRVMRAWFLYAVDKRALVLMDRFFRFQLGALGERPMRGWAVARVAENMEAVLFLYNLTEQKHLLRLCDLLKEQSLDWTDEFHIFPHIRATAKQRPWQELRQGMEREGGLGALNQRINSREYHLTEAVNVAFGLKTPGVINLFKSGFKEVNAFRLGWQRLIKQHGVALGMYTGDGHLAGTDPRQGVDLEAVAEMINTIRTLTATGEDMTTARGDLLEKLAFNALPAAWSQDMKRRQKVEQVNQVAATKARRSWYNDPDDANQYIERPMGLAEQGFPAFSGALWYATSDEGLAAEAYAPCTVNFVAGGTRVRVKVETNYPFSGAITLSVAVRESAEFPIYLRIPGWAGQVMLRLPDGELMQMRGGEIACVRRKWSGEETVGMDLPMEPRTTRWHHQSCAVELGPLLMCLRLLPYETKAGFATSDRWRWALDAREPMKAVFDEEARAFKQGMDGAKVLVKARRAPGWDMDGASCAAPPIAPETEEGTEQVLELTPYGHSDLRIAQFPVVGD